MSITLLLLLCFVASTYAAQAVGKDVHLNLRSGRPAVFECQLEGNVQYEQVTWQKKQSPSAVNLMTYSSTYGSTLNSQPHQGRLSVFGNATYSSLTLSNVVAQDAGCYLCLFNSFGHGKLTGTACLTVYAVPNITVRQYTIYVCEAEAYPEPQVTWNTTDQRVQRHHNISSGSHGMKVHNIFTQVATDPKDLKCVTTWNETDTVIEMHRHIEVPYAETHLHHPISTARGRHHWATVGALLFVLILALILFLFICCRSPLPRPKHNFCPV